MKFALETSGDANRFTACGEGFVEVNGERHRANVAVSPDGLRAGWFAGPIEALAPADFGPIAEMRPEIVLFGSGARFRFPPPAALAPLHSAGIGVEVMDTGAACRTFNVLVAEGRRVVAALIVD